MVVQATDQSASDVVDVSVVIPLLSEEDNVVPLYEELAQVISADTREYELIFVDDGSKDRTIERLSEVAKDDGRVTIIQLTKHFGQTAALSAGIRQARGRVIVPMDGDLQNDPHDIPRLVAKLDDPPGWDIVSGWRKKRQDKFLSRRLPSQVANRLVGRLTATTKIHDFGCSLKAYRAEVLEDVRIYGEMHRYLAAICRWRGARVTEMEVNHRPRVAGTSKYGLKRVVKVVLDLMTVKFLGDYLTKPIYFFGKLAMVVFGMSILSLGLAVVQKLGYLTEHGAPVMLNNNVFVLFAMMLVLMSVNFLMVGVVSELLVRIYHESRGLEPYKSRRISRCGRQLPSREEEVEATSGNGHA